MARADGRIGMGDALLGLHRRRGQGQPKPESDPNSEPEEQGTAAMSNTTPSVRRRVKQSLVSSAVEARGSMSRSMPSAESLTSESCPTVRPGSFSLRITKSGRLQVVCFEAPRPRRPA